jgi:hypothetical protein
MESLVKIKVLLLFLILFSVIIHSNPFSDVPKEHWAYDAVNELIDKGYMGGFPDGFFKGDGTVTRYEMAVTIAKILDRVRDVQTSGGFIDAKEAATIRKLSTEFKDELEALGIRVGNLEDRVKKLEESQNDLKGETEKFKIYGSYYSELGYTVRTGTGDSSKTGFHDPYHEVSLELISKPSTQSEFYMNMENGLTDYSSSPEFDGFVTETVSTYEVSVPGGGTVEVSDTVKYRDKIDYDDSNYLKIKSLHYKLKAPRANMRFFFKESFSSLDDSVGLLNNPWHAKLGYSKGSGLELDGNLNKDTSYFAGVYQLHSSGNGSSDTLLTLRPRYKVPTDVLLDGSLTVGGFYIQSFMDNDTDKVKYKSVRGMDFEFIKNSQYSFSSTLTVMKNERNDGADINENISESGLRLTASYKRDKLSSDMTFYNYEEDFALYYAPDYYYAFQNDGYFSGRDEWFYMWGDAYKFGERFFELNNTYTMDFGEGKSAYVKLNYLKLWWDKYDNTDSWYNYDADKFELNIYGTFSNRFKADILNTIKKDPAKDEEGFYKNELKLYATVNPANSTKVELGVWSEKDNDKLNKAGNAFRGMGVWGSTAWNATDTIYMKTGFDYGKSGIGWDAINSDGDREKRWWTIYLENSIDLTSTTALESTIYYGKTGEYGQDLPDKKFFRTVLSNSFSSRLKGRFGYWWKQYTDDTQKQHVYADINYKAEDGTKIQFWYSPPWDSNYYTFDKTNFYSDYKDTFKKFKLTVSTNF